MQMQLQVAARSEARSGGYDSGRVSRLTDEHAPQKQGAASLEPDVRDSSKSEPCWERSVDSAQLVRSRNLLASKAAALRRATYAMKAYHAVADAFTFQLSEFWEDPCPRATDWTQLLLTRSATR